MLDPGETTILDVDVVTDCYDPRNYVHAQPFVDEPSGSGITFDPPTYTKNSTFHKNFVVTVPQGTPGGQYLIDVKAWGCGFTVYAHNPPTLIVTGPGPSPTPSSTATASPTATATPTPSPTPTSPASKSTPLNSSHIPFFRIPSSA